MANSDPDLDQFLKKVDNLESILKGLNSGDASLQKDSMDKADAFMQQQKALEVQKEKKYPPVDNTGVNRTVINQKAFDKPVQPQVNSHMSQNAFMNVMELDIQARTERRKKNCAEAMRIKDLGNEQFKEGNYEKAVELYSEALTHFKNNTILWTNRAQAYIKLREYEKALEDCDWALRVHENCLKAYIHQGKAYLGLKEYDKAIASYQQAIQVDPKKENAIQEYIAEVERVRKADGEEAGAKALFESGHEGSAGLVELLQRVNKEDQLPLYYAGGLRVIRELLMDTNDKTLFRTNGGLLLTETHPVISRCFQAKPRSLSREQLDMCTSALEVLKAACAENEENCRCALEVSSLPDQLLTFLQTHHKSCQHLRLASLRLLYIISQQEVGRQGLCKMNLSRLCNSLFSLLEVSAISAINAVGLLNNLALEKKFKIELRQNVEEAILPAFEKLLTNGCSQPSVLPSCITMVTNLSGDAHIRRTLLGRRSLWDVLVKALKLYAGRLNQPNSSEVVCEVLGLLMNLTLEKSDLAEQCSVAMCGPCAQLVSQRDQTLETRALGVLSHMLPRSTAAVENVCANGLAERLVDVLKVGEPSYLKLALKCLTACTAETEQARQAVVDKKGLSCLVSLLKNTDEMVFGNAALCLSHVAMRPKVCEQLTKTNIIQHLLVLARDGRDTQVQHNCSILIARLTKGNVKHLERLRELHGIEILVDVMKNVKD